MVELRALAAFDGLLNGTAPDPAGVWAQALPEVALATVIARRGASAALAERVLALWDARLPQGPQRTQAGKLALVGSGPGLWTAVRYGAGADWETVLRSAIGDLAAVTDQTGGQAVIRLGGLAVAEVLAKGVNLDLHPSTFPPGSAAATVVAHVSVQLWRLQDGDFELAIPRSFVPAFAHWLQGASLEIGLHLAQPRL